VIDPVDALTDRVTQLERRLRRSHALIVAFIAAIVGLGILAFTFPSNSSDVVRTRQLVIEDASGHARVIIGAPVRDNYERASPTSGMVIRDSLGRERFGVGLDAHGKMGLGLDAPQCTSTPCNTERINLDADAEGGAQLRFLDRHTGVAARMVLDDDDHVYLDFVKVQRDSVRLRRLGLHTDTNSVVPLK
jgi:hypothetical protein